MIHELLSVGAENARTGKEIAEALGVEPRMVTKQIEKERRAGYPICASVVNKGGYYLAKNSNDLGRYCGSLARRNREVGKTLGALLLTHDRMVHEEMGDVLPLIGQEDLDGAGAPGD